MNKKINLVELLRDCPKGTKFYSRALGTVTFNCIKSDMICMKDHKGIEIAYSKSGKYYYAEKNAVIDLFPSKDQRDWSKWQRPFVEGDVVMCGDDQFAIFKQHIKPLENGGEIIRYYVYYDAEDDYLDTVDGQCYMERLATEEEKAELFQAIKDNGYKWNTENKTLENWTILDAKDGDVIFYDDGWTCIFKRIHGIWYSSYCFVTSDGEFNMGYEEHAVDSKINGNAHLATKEQCNLLFQKIKEAGYKWNPETKTLVKLIVPKFKVGDTIRAKNGLQAYTITGVTSEYYSVKVGEHACIGVLPVKDQDDWILIPNKFDPKTLKPFDKVLVRQYDVSTWCADFYSYYDEAEDYAECTGGIHYNFCIPYNDDTKHLVGKSKDAPDFYRYWEDK